MCACVMECDACTSCYSLITWERLCFLFIFLRGVGVLVSLYTNVYSRGVWCIIQSVVGVGEMKLSGTVVLLFSSLGFCL